MDKAILVLNIGYSSIKFGIIDPDKGEKTLDIAYCGKIEESGHQTQFVIERMRGRGSGVLPVDDGNSLHTYEEALQAMYEHIASVLLDYQKTRADGRVIVVHSGNAVIHEKSTLCIDVF